MWKQIQERKLKDEEAMAEVLVGNEDNFEDVGVVNASVVEDVGKVDMDRMAQQDRVAVMDNT